MSELKTIFIIFLTIYIFRSLWLFFFEIKILEYHRASGDINAEQLEMRKIEDKLSKKLTIDALELLRFTRKKVEPKKEVWYKHIYGNKFQGSYFVNEAITKERWHKFNNECFMSINVDRVIEKPEWIK